MERITENAISEGSRQSTRLAYYLATLDSGRDPDQVFASEPHTIEVVKNQTFKRGVSLDEKYLYSSVVFENCVFEKGFEFLVVRMLLEDDEKTPVPSTTKYRQQPVPDKRLLYFRSCSFNQPSLVFAAKGWAVDLVHCKMLSNFLIIPAQDFANRIRLHTVEISKKLEIKPNIVFSTFGGEPRCKISELSLVDIEVSSQGSVLIDSVESVQSRFRRISLGDKSQFLLNRVNPGSCTFSNVMGIESAKVTFSDVALQMMSFESSNLSTIRFINSQWPRQPDGRRSIWSDSSFFDLGQFQKYLRNGTTTEDLNALEHLAGTYSQLVNNFETARNFEVAEDFHYRELEIARIKPLAKAAATPGRSRQLRIWLAFLGSILGGHGLYKFSSDYGTSYTKAAKVLIGLLATLPLAFMLVGFEDSQTAKRTEYSIRVAADPFVASRREIIEDYLDSLAMTLAIVTLQKDRHAQPVGATGSALASIAIVLVAGQTALLVFALRRRFRRASI
ncbi:MAG: hypothetical protein SF172_10140 [Burkholderiales bacterium]|nr:hypothetical protein [Burkholderiales bacterium]